MTVNKLQLPAKDNAIQLKINEIIDNLGGGGTVDQTFDSTSPNAQSGTAVLDMLETIYPVGSLYLTVNNTCPLEALFGTWQSVGTSIVTSVSSTTSTSATLSIKGNGYTTIYTKSLSGRGGLVGDNEYFYSGSSAVGHRTSNNSTNFGFSTTEGYAGLTGSVTIPSLTPSKTSLTCYIFKRTA